MGDLSSQSVSSVTALVSPPAIRFNSKFSEAYVQTRHKNLRCFPICSPLHMEKSFCGRVIEVDVTFSTDCPVPDGRPVLVGEFRCTMTSPALRIGETVTSDQYSNPRFITAELVLSEPNDLRFVINPNRKWYYPRTTAEGELHVYTVYLIMGERVIAQLDSPLFKVLPIWKEERRPSVLGMPAGPKNQISLQQQQQHQLQQQQQSDVYVQGAANDGRSIPNNHQRMFSSDSTAATEEECSDAGQMPNGPLPWSNMAAYQQPLASSQHRPQHLQQQQQLHMNPFMVGHQHQQSYHQQFTPVSSSSTPTSNVYGNPFMKNFYDMQQQQQQSTQRAFFMPSPLTQSGQQQLMGHFHHGQMPYSNNSEHQQQQQQFVMAQYAMAMASTVPQQAPSDDNSNQATGASARKLG